MQRKSWLALSYTVPINPSKARVYVWRKLKEYGAEYLKQGVALLPHTAQGMQQFTRLAQKIRQMGGEACIFELRFTDPADEAQMTARFRRQIEQEYQELLDDCASAMRELRRAGKRLSQTQGEQLRQMVKRYQKARARDHFKEAAAGEIEAGINEIIDSVREVAGDLGRQLRALMDK